MPPDPVCKDISIWHILSLYYSQFPTTMPQEENLRLSKVPDYEIQILSLNENAIFSLFRIQSTG
jgi:hypothetical protein